MNNLFSMSDSDLIKTFTVLHVGSEWKEFFYDTMIPWYHYIPVPDAKQGISDEDQMDTIEDLLQFLKSNDKYLENRSGNFVAQQIASNGRKFIQNHLRMKDIESYWYHLLTNYIELLDFKPSLNKDYLKIKK